jgi:copper resistance protein D
MWWVSGHSATILEVNLFHIILVWIHLVAASFWVGGMLFLSLVAVPLFKIDPDLRSAQGGFVNLARRFRMLVWLALSMLVVTGKVLLGTVITYSAPLSSWPPAVALKLILVLLLVVVSLAHDRVIGPKIRKLKQQHPAELSSRDRLLLPLSPLIGRLTMLLGLAVLFAAALMVRV